MKKHEELLGNSVKSLKERRKESLEIWHRKLQTKCFGFHRRTVFHNNKEKPEDTTDKHLHCCTSAKFLWKSFKLRLLNQFSSGTSKGFSWSVKPSTEQELLQNCPGRTSHKCTGFQRHKVSTQVHPFII